jgi:hypothetical protein
MDVVSASVEQPMDQTKGRASGGNHLSWLPVGIGLGPWTGVIGGCPLNGDRLCRELAPELPHKQDAHDQRGHGYRKERDAGAEEDGVMVDDA